MRVQVPQTQSWPFWPLSEPSLAIPPQSPFPAHSSCSLCISTGPSPLRPSGLHSYLLRIPGLLAVSCLTSHLVLLTRLFLVTLCMFVCQVGTSQFWLLLPPSRGSPFRMEKVFDLNRRGALSSPLALHWMSEMFLFNRTRNTRH